MIVISNFRVRLGQLKVTRGQLWWQVRRSTCRACMSPW